MYQKQLFLKVLEDLENKANSNDWYDILLISGLIYKLLYDEQPLADKINIGKKEIVFKVNNRSVPNDPSLIFWSIEDGIDPETSVPYFTQPIQVDRSGLYSRGVMIFKGEIITVKDLVRFLRNKQGAVHSDSISLSDKDKLMKELQATLFIGGINSGLRLMRAISRVVIRGLDSLK